MEAWTEEVAAAGSGRPAHPLGHVTYPANNQHTGTGQSNYEQMGAVFEEAGIPTMLGAH